MPGMSGSTPRKPTTPNRPAVTPQPKRKKTHTCAPLSLSLSLSNSAKPTRKKKKKCHRFARCNRWKLRVESSAPHLTRITLTMVTYLLRDTQGSALILFAVFFLYFLSLLFLLLVAGGSGEEGRQDAEECTGKAIKIQDHKNKI